MIAAVASGSPEGDRVVAEGLQRARPGLTVSPAPASPDTRALLNTVGEWLRRPELPHRAV